MDTEQHCTFPKKVAGPSDRSNRPLDCKAGLGAELQIQLLSSDSGWFVGNPELMPSSDSSIGGSSPLHERRNGDSPREPFWSRIPPVASNSECIPRRALDRIGALRSVSREVPPKSGSGPSRYW